MDTFIPESYICLRNKESGKIYMMIVMFLISFIFYLKLVAL